MRMLVLGAGLQGSACAYDLLQQPGVERVTIADLVPDRIPRSLEPQVGKRLTLLRLDVQDGAAPKAHRVTQPEDDSPCSQELLQLQSKQERRIESHQAEGDPGSAI